MATMLFQGHGSYRLETKDGVVVYVDPFAGEGYDVQADLILITHEHFDHNQTDKVPQKETTKIYRAADMLQNGVYRSICEYGIRVTAVPAYNKNHDPNACVGYVVEMDQVKMYLAGDTSETAYMPELAKQALDYAILPTDGVYNMDVEEASRCAAIIGAKHSIPIHMKPGGIFDKETAEKFRAAGKLIVLPGEKIKL